MTESGTNQNQHFTQTFDGTASDDIDKKGLVNSYSLFDAATTSFEAWPFGRDLVIAPYASALAMMVDPVAGLANQEQLLFMAFLGLPLAVWYFGWLLNPDRIGTSYLYGILIVAELFNLTQALGFW